MVFHDAGVEGVGRCFPNAEAAVAVCVDSKERISLGKDPICHAYVYVNAIELETGKKIVISNSCAWEVHDIVRDMCGGRGMAEAERRYHGNAKGVISMESLRADAERNSRWCRRDPLRRSVEYDRSVARKGGVGRYECGMAKSGSGRFFKEKILALTFARRPLSPSSCKPRIWLWSSQRARACPCTHLLRGGAFEGLRFSPLLSLYFDTVGTNQI